MDSDSAESCQSAWAWWGVLQSSQWYHVLIMSIQFTCKHAACMHVNMCLLTKQLISILTCVMQRHATLTYIVFPCLLAQHWSLCTWLTVHEKNTAMDRFKLSYQTPKGIMEPIRFIDQDMKQVKHMERLQLKPGRNHFLLRTVRFNFVVTWLPERRLFPRWKIFCSKTAASVSRSTALWTRTCKGLFFKSLPVFW